jgi:hypothetical protein
MKLTTIKKGMTSSLIVCFALAASASASLIDFETLPGGTPADNTAITTQYSAPADGGVNFYYYAGTNATPGLSPTGLGAMYMEATGDDGDNGFGYGLAGDPTYEYDYDADPSHDLGSFLLRGPSDVSARSPFTMIIKYSEPTTAFGGEIWDIDANDYGTERWQVKVYGETDTLQPWSDTANPSLLSPDGLPIDDSNTLDGKAWDFSYQAPQNVTIDEVHIVFVGTKESTIGLAFDNFNSTAVPEPATMSLLGLGGMLLALRRRRR